MHFAHEIRLTAREMLSAWVDLFHWKWKQFRFGGTVFLFWPSRWRSIARLLANVSRIKKEKKEHLCELICFLFSFRTQRDINSLRVRHFLCERDICLGKRYPLRGMVDLYHIAFKRKTKKNGQYAQKTRLSFYLKWLCNAKNVKNLKNCIDMKWILW